MYHYALGSSATAGGEPHWRSYPPERAELRRFWLRPSLHRLQACARSRRPRPSVIDETGDPGQSPHNLIAERSHWKVAAHRHSTSHV